MTSTILFSNSLPKYGDFLGIYRSKNALHNNPAISFSSEKQDFQDFQQTGEL